MTHPAIGKTAHLIRLDQHEPEEGVVLAWDAGGVLLKKEDDTWTHFYPHHQIKEAVIEQEDT